MRYSLVQTPSTFDPARRPIYIHPIASVTRKLRDDAYPLLATAIDRIASKHPQDRILIHTVSYDLAAYLTASCEQSTRDRFISYSVAADRQGAISKYLEQPGSILVASSLDRGIDLPGSDCRAIIVAKVPYPNLGDNQISARFHSKGGQLWYNVQTIRSLVQMTGRGMRSEDDFCSSYILDRQFVDSIWKKSKSLLPKWWSEALVWNAGKL